MEEVLDKLGYKDFSGEGGVTSCCKRYTNILKRQHCERRGMNAMSGSIIRENFSGYVHIMRTHKELTRQKIWYDHQKEDGQKNSVEGVKMSIPRRAETQLSESSNEIPKVYQNFQGSYDDHKKE